MSDADFPAVDCKYLGGFFFAHIIRLHLFQKGCSAHC